jgi:hypothetical protein
MKGEVGQRVRASERQDFYLSTRIRHLNNGYGPLQLLINGDTNNPTTNSNPCQLGLPNRTSGASTSGHHGK